MSIFKNHEIYKLDIAKKTYQAYYNDNVYSIFGIPYARLAQDAEGNKKIFSPPLDLVTDESRQLFPGVRPEISNEYFYNQQEGFPVCLQPSSEYPESPECQNLNVYFPKSALESEQKLACLFYIHGGSFMNGSSLDPEIDGEYLANKLNTVIIIPNYRLGPLGYFDFSHRDPSSSSNNAYRDLISALRWVNREIENFGGDKNNVTIMGESSGGTMVSAFPFINEAQGLFNKLIILSGIPAAFVSIEESQSRANDFITFAEIAKVKDLYRESSWPEFSKAIKEYSFYCKLGSSTYTPQFGDSILTKNPIAMFRDLSLAEEKLDIPIWCNMTKNEMTVLVKLPHIAESWGMTHVFDAGLKAESDNWQKEMKSSYNTYYGESAAESQFITDALIGGPLSWYAEEASKVTPVYFTRLDWASPLQRISNLGAFHTSDLYLIFGNRYARHGKLFFSGLLSDKPFKSISAEMQHDLKHFMSWSKLLAPGGKSLLATYDKQNFHVKAYDEVTSLKENMPANLYSQWKESKFYQETFSSN